MLWPRPPTGTWGPATGRNRSSRWWRACGRGWPSCSRCPTTTRWLWATAGTTCFWDAATFGLIDRKSQHLSFGEFSSKFATAVAEAPHLDDPEIIASEVGTHPCRWPGTTSTSTP